jgi:hypothetical protein
LQSSTLFLNLNKWQYHENWGDNFM